MSIKRANIHVEPIVYLKDTNGDYVLDTDGNKIIVKSGTEVSANDDYETKTVITEYYTWTDKLCHSMN